MLRAASRSGRSTPVSVRVKDIDRLEHSRFLRSSISLADGEPIAKRASLPADVAARLRDLQVSYALHQPRFPHRAGEAPRPSRCRLRSTCTATGGDRDAQFPLAQAGNPTINARLLLHDE